MTSGEGQRQMFSQAKFIRVCAGGAALTVTVTIAFGSVCLQFQQIDYFAA
jgi:hypothetical protein